MSPDFDDIRLKVISHAPWHPYESRIPLKATEFTKEFCIKYYDRFIFNNIASYVFDGADLEKFNALHKIEMDKYNSVCKNPNSTAVNMAEANYEIKMNAAINFGNIVEDIRTREKVNYGK